MNDGQQSQAIGFVVLLAVALLFLWGMVSGKIADASAAILSPALLDNT